MILRLLLVCALSLSVACLAPPLQVETSSREAILDVRSMGEYPSSVRRIQLEVGATGEVVWAVESLERPRDLWKVSLTLGTNPVMPTGMPKGAFRVLVPRDGDTFTLLPNSQYRVLVEGSSGRTAQAKLVLSD
jgi:hypothetical protein